MSRDLREAGIPSDRPLENSLRVTIPIVEKIAIAVASDPFQTLMLKGLRMAQELRFDRLHISNDENTFIFHHLSERFPIAYNMYSAFSRYSGLPESELEFHPYILDAFRTPTLVVDVNTDQQPPNVISVTW